MCQPLCRAEEIYWRAKPETASTSWSPWEGKAKNQMINYKIVILQSTSKGKYTAQREIMKRKMDLMLEAGKASLKKFVDTWSYS